VRIDQGRATDKREDFKMKDYNFGRRHDDNPLKNKAAGYLALFTLAFCATAVLIAVAVMKGVI
jgi:hypothetical protein